MLLELETKTQPLIIKTSLSGHSDAVSFSIDPYGEPDGKVVTMTVEDLPRGLIFNWADDVWDNLPEVTVGSGTLIVGAVFENVGNVGGTFDMTMVDDVGAVLGQRLGIFLGAGISTILRPYPIDMPDKVYGIDIAVTP